MIEIKTNFPVYPNDSGESEITVELSGDHTEDQPTVMIEVQGNDVIPDGSYTFTSQQAVVMAVNSGSICGIDNPEAVARIGKEVTFMQVAYNTLRDMGNLL